MWYVKYNIVWFEILSILLERIEDGVRAAFLTNSKKKMIFISMWMEENYYA